jgi:dTDP-4-dehydrorhamnose 3,5-epimerase
MKKNINDAVYEVAEMSESKRYWFRREFCDLRYGNDRLVIISVEKMTNKGGSYSQKLPWSLKIEERRSQQYWNLMAMSIDGEEKLYFERFVRGKKGEKDDILDLGFLPEWIIEEIRQVGIEMEQRGYDRGGSEFLKKLADEIVTEKEAVRSKLTAKVEETKIRGLFHILSQTRGDDRGSFREVVRFPEIELLTGYDFVGKQVNHSYSIYGTLRGLHVEPWAKLVTVISGLAVCVLLDCRSKSRTYGKMETIYLGFGKTPDGQQINGGAIFVEPGIANSFMVLSEKLDYAYVVDDLWRPDTATFAVNPFDEKLAISWEKYVPMDKIIRSERDMKSPSFKEFSETLK